jgi:hypothetical protein
MKPKPLPWRRPREPEWDGKRQIVDHGGPLEFNGRSPPPGAKPGRPWFAPDAESWVDEHGVRWPRSTLPEGAQLPAAPNGDEPLGELIGALRRAEQNYQPVKDREWDDYS